MTEMLGLVNKSPVQVGQAKSIHHMITQLVREPSDHTSTRRPSLMVHSERRPSQMDPDIPPSLRRGSQFVTTEYSSLRRSSQMIDIPYRTRRPSSAGQRLSSAGQRPSSAGQRPSSAGHGSSAEQRSSSAGQRPSSAGHGQRLSSADRRLSTGRRVADRRVSSTDQEYRSRRHTLPSIPEVIGHLNTPEK